MLSPSGRIGAGGARPQPRPGFLSRSSDLTPRGVEPGGPRLGCLSARWGLTIGLLVGVR
jgi:hypothetical protein